MGETNADPGIAALLEAERRDYYGIPQRVGIDIPAAIDDATDRANRIPAVHLLWQQGCGADPQSPAARSCRGKVLGFALQFRLTKSLGFSNEESPEWKEFMQTFATNWRARWPHGLLLSSPDVPNRIPVPENGELNPLRQPQCRKLRMPAKSGCINKAIFHPRWSHCGLVPLWRSGM